jgi:NADPH2:quinone reductase
MSGTMRACLVRQLSDDFSGLAVEEVPRPAPGPGEVSIQVRACALNFPDLLMTRGGYQHKPDLPFVPGMEAAGEVSETGDGVAGFRAGDKVIAGLRTGGLAEIAVAPAEGLRSLPPGFTFAEGAGFQVAALTAYVGLVVRGGLAAGETVLIHGAAGGVGLAAVELARHLGARVIATASTPEKRALAEARGADAALPPEGFRQTVKDLTGGKGADVIYDPVGGDVFDESLRCIAWNGRLLVIGFTSGRIPKVDANIPLIKGFSVVGVRAGEFGRRDPEAGRANLDAIYGLAAQGVMKPHIGATLPLARAGEALALLAGRQALGKVVVTP